MSGVLTAVQEGTAVYVGIQQMEYSALAAAHAPSMGAFTATSQAFSVAAGRLSFVFGLKGPAVCSAFLKHVRAHMLICKQSNADE